MPVVFFVDPAIVEDPIPKRRREITLSYTFYPTPNPRADGGRAPQRREPFNDIDGALAPRRIENRGAKTMAEPPSTTIITCRPDPGRSSAPSAR